MSKIYYILDIQVTEKAATLERAREIAECWMDEQRAILADADDCEVERWARSGSRGLDAGDVEIWLQEEGEAPTDGELVESYSGRNLTEAEAEKRGIRYVG